MWYRQLGASGLRISVLAMGTMTFGGTGGFSSVGSTDLDEAKRQIDQSMEAGVNLIDTANVYSAGLSEEILGQATLGALDDLVRAGKVRYVGCSNYAGWQLMKALGIADRHGLPRFVSQQIHYTLQAREAEYELVPISIDQALGILV
jgi:aryl-alcohol dehydrogenase-like predicted oxidoreductase